MAGAEASLRILKALRRETPLVADASSKAAAQAGLTRAVNIAPRRSGAMAGTGRLFGVVGGTTFGFTSAYAPRRNWGFHGTDSLGRTYSDEGSFFMEKAIQLAEAHAVHVRNYRALVHRVF